MTAAIDLTIDNSADWLSDLYTWVDSTGTAVNVTGCTASFRVAARTGDISAPILVSLTQASGITLGGSAGTFQFFMASADTIAIPPGVYVYDFFLYGVIGTVAVFKVLYGSFTVRGQVL